MLPFSQRLLWPVAHRRLHGFHYVTLFISFISALFSLSPDAAARGLRPHRETVCIPDAHSQQIRDVDYNPNKLHHVCTAGSDRTRESGVRLSAHLQCIASLFWCFV